MTKSIRSYKDLLEEKQRLEVLLVEQRQLLRNDVQELKTHLEPLKQVVDFIRKITTKDKTALVTHDRVRHCHKRRCKTVYLIQSGLVGEKCCALFSKNYSSHFLAEQKDKWIEKLRSWLGPQEWQRARKRKGSIG
jgi:hypothetical protein